MATFALAAGLMIAGCGTEVGSGAASDGSVRQYGSTTPTGGPGSPAAPQDPSEGGSTMSDTDGRDGRDGMDDVDDVTTAAVADLAAKLSVAQSAVTVVSAAAVTWRDGSVGCPEKGMGYIQMLTPGYLVILDVAGTQYRYHAGRSGPAKLCAAADAQDPLPASEGPA